jgi:hypothetical protein
MSSKTAAVSELKLKSLDPAPSFRKTRSRFSPSGGAISRRREKGAMAAAGAMDVSGVIQLQQIHALN